MANANSNVEIQEKSPIEIQPNADHIESDLKEQNETVLKSNLDNLGLLATVKRFWKVRVEVYMS